MPPNVLGTGRYGRILDRLLDLNQGDSAAPVVGAEISPVLVLECDRPEWEFLAGGQLCWGTLTVAASVGNFSIVQLFNPVGSNVLVVVEGLNFVNDTGATNRISASMDSQAVGTDANSNIVRDSRRPGIPPGMNQAGVAQVRTAQVAAPPLGSIAMQFILGTASGLFVPVNVVLSPGFGMSLRPSSVNLAMTGGFVWRERSMEPGEVRKG